MYIGVDLGGTNIAVGLVDENGKIIQRKSVKTDSSRDYKEILKDMALCAKAVVEESGVGFDTVKAVGIGSPGTIDSKNGVIIYANNLHFDHVPIVEEFKKHYDIDVYIDNDGNCAAFGEVLFGGAQRTLWQLPSEPALARVSLSTVRSTAVLTVPAVNTGIW